MTEQAEITAFYELSQAKARYCRGLDTRDWPGLAALMTVDVEFGMSDGESEPEMITGREAPTTDLITCRASMPVTVMPMDAIVPLERPTQDNTLWK